MSYCPEEVARARREEGRYWSRDRIVAAFQEFNAAMGRAPATFDAHFNVPSWRHGCSEARIIEAERARELGLHLPSADICRREFGSWVEAVLVAGLEPNVAGARRTASTVSTTGISHGPILCPSCGDTRWRMDEVTGWCASCTREHLEMAPA